MPTAILKLSQVVLTLTVCSIATAQDHPLAPLSEVVVKGQMITARDSAFTATALTTEEVRAHAYADIDDLFRLVPGMAVRDLQLGSVANSIVIRGFGGGGHGGDLGAVIDGIPLNEAMSHADGYVDLNTIIPLEIESFTVLKGPVSALYGNFNRGGLVNVQTRKGGDYSEADVSLGSYDTLDLQLARGTALGARQQLNIAGQIYRTDGFRPQSRTERGTAAGRWAYDLSPTLQLALSGRYLQSESDSASYLTREQFENDPTGIDSRVHNDGAEKEFLTVRGDLNYELREDLKLLTFAYTTQQDFTRWFSRPIDATTWRQREETYDRSVFGAGTSLNGLALLSAVKLRYTAGFETFREATEFKFFDGLDHRRRIAQAQSDRDTSLNSVSAFAEVSADFHRLAQLMLGVRADRFTGGCERSGAETGSDPCGPLNQANHVSPKIGLRSEVTDWLALRASWAEGFALANGFVKYAIGGQPLDETVFRQTEIGAHLNAAAFDFDVAAYRLSSNGEVRTVSPGIYENYGETLRRGIEASAAWRPNPQFELRAIYGVTKAEVERNFDARLLGLTLPGVPKRSATLETTIDVLDNWRATGAWRYVGPFEVDALNSLRAESYALIDIGLSYTREAAPAFRAYAFIDNVTDRNYVTSVSLIGGQQLVAPGMPRSFRAGIQVDF